MIHQRITLSTPDGSTAYCDTFPFSPPDRPWFCNGMRFATPEAAQAWIDANWNSPQPPIDMSYARAESCFGELP